ncbi:UNVERIFIED_CONTAM: hypothetical protein NCL1_58483 [Trichonephila clavipes]
MLENSSGCSCLVVKLTNLCLAYHEFDPSIAKDPPSMMAMHVKSVEGHSCSRLCIVKVRRGGCQFRCYLRPLTTVHMYEVHRKKPSSCRIVRRSYSLILVLSKWNSIISSTYMYAEKEREID